MILSPVSGSVSLDREVDREKSRVPFKKISQENSFSVFGVMRVPELIAETVTLLRLLE